MRGAAFVFLAAATTFGLVHDAEAGARYQRILVLNSYHAGMDWTDAIVRGIQDGFRESEVPTQLFLEYLDVQRRQQAAAADSRFVQYLRDRYRDVDLIIATDDEAFDFVVNTNAAMFGDTPVVFCGVDVTELAKIRADRPVSGVVDTMDYLESLALARRLRPEARAIHVFGNGGPMVLSGPRIAQRFLEELDYDLPIRFLNDLTVEEMVEAAGEIPPDDFVIALALAKDRDGLTLFYAQTQAVVSEFSPAPVFYFWSTGVEQGHQVGGVMGDPGKQGQVAAELALRVIRGEDPRAIPIVKENPTVTVFNHRALRRHGIAESLLPADSVVLDRPRSVYEENKTLVWSTLFVLGALISLVVLLGVNVQNRKRAESELVAYRDQLEDLVRRRTHELEDAQAVLLRQERLAAIGELTATVSHELRNPLGTIAGSFHVLKTRLGTVPAGAERALARIDRSIERCTTIISELLDYSQAHEPRLQMIQLDTWIEDALDEEAVPDTVVVERNFSADATAEIDPLRLRQVLTNLINNALHSMVREGTDQPSGTLRCTTRTRGDRIELAVSDDGEGITTDNMARLFEPLFSTKSFGVGLGLPLVKKIMEQHGGGVEVQSEPGKGTTVTLWLPGAAPAPG